MEKQTVFIKVSVKDRIPSVSDFYHTNKGIAYYSDIFEDWSYDDVEYWLEEIELPSEEEIDKSGDDFAYPHIDSAFAFNCFMHGAKFILNKLKGESK